MLCFSLQMKEHPRKGSEFWILSVCLLPVSVLAVPICNAQCISAGIADKGLRGYEMLVFGSYGVIYSHGIFKHETIWTDCSLQTSFFTLLVKGLKAKTAALFLLSPFICNVATLP